MKNSENYIIRDYEKGDEKEITSLFYSVFGKEMTIEQWNWKYAIPGRGRIYSKVVEDSFKKIIGHAGAIPLRGVFNNKPIQFFQIVDVMVHPKARGFLGKKNVFNSLMKTLFEDIRKEFFFVFCYGFPGGRPYILGERVGVYEKIEQAVEEVKQLSRSFLYPYRVRKINWDDDRLDGLWSRVSKDFTLSLIRDKKYLNWRYAINPCFSYTLHGFFLLGKLNGWMVTKDSGDEVQVVDIFANRKRYRNVLKALANYLIPHKKKSIRLWLPVSLRKDIKVKGYIENKTDVVVTNMVWKLPIQTNIARENLYYTMGDADIF